MRQWQAAVNEKSSMRHCGAALVFEPLSAQCLLFFRKSVQNGLLFRIRIIVGFTAKKREKPREFFDKSSVHEVNICFRLLFR
jgi:hypothetical protein